MSHLSLPLPRGQWGPVGAAHLSFPRGKLSTKPPTALRALSGLNFHTLCLTGRQVLWEELQRSLWPAFPSGLTLLGMAPQLGEDRGPHLRVTALLGKLNASGSFWSSWLALVSMGPLSYTPLSAGQCPILATKSSWLMRN